MVAFWHSSLCSDQPFFRQSGPQNDTDLYRVTKKRGKSHEKVKQISDSNKRRHTGTRRWQYTINVALYVLAVPAVRGVIDVPFPAREAIQQFRTIAHLCFHHSAVTKTSISHTHLLASFHGCGSDR